MSRGGKRDGAGRKQGVPNKVTAQTRTYFADFLDANQGQMQSLFEQLESPKDKLWFILQGAEYVMPKLNRTTVDGPGDDGEIIITHRILKSREDLKDAGA